MTEISGRVATTHVIEQAGVQVAFTKEALESLSEQANGECAAPIIVEHNPFCLPIGKTIEAWVEPFGNEYALMSRIYIEDNPQCTIHPESKVALAHLNFNHAPKPFLKRRVDSEESDTALIIDLTSFADQEESDAFARELKAVDPKVSLQLGGRFSLGPEPLIQLVISDAAVTSTILKAFAGVAAWWSLKRAGKFVTYTIDETLRKVAAELSDSLSGKLIGFLRAYKNRQPKNDRPITSQIIIPTDKTHLILLAKTERDEEDLRIDLAKLITEIAKYADLLEDAEEATFARIGIDDWEFLYLKTKSGRVIGTMECYQKTLRELNRDKGFSIDIGEGHPGS